MRGRTDDAYLCEQWELSPVDISTAYHLQILDILIFLYGELATGWRSST